MSIVEIAAASPDGIGLPSSRQPDNVLQSSSFLETLLLCMSADQRANLLAAFTDGIIYTNRVPSCAQTIPLKLTRKAQNQLMAMFGHLSGTGPDRAGRGLHAGRPDARRQRHLLPGSGVDQLYETGLGFDGEDGMGNQRLLRRHLPASDGYVPVVSGKT